LIGNDIVDLSVARKESNCYRKGFLKKLFTDHEQQLITSSKDSFNLVWRFWSMKEAAYKIYTQIHHIRFFAPRKFNCIIISEKEGLVNFKDQFFFTSSILNKSFISSIASKEKITKAYSKFVKPELIDLTIKKKLAGMTTFPAKKITKKKLRNGVPFYFHKNTKLTKSCSISHHGDYGIFSFILI